MQFEDGLLKLHPIKNCEEGIINRFIDNTACIGKGQSQKDKTLSVLKAIGNIAKPLGSKVTIKDLYNSFMCKYRIENQDTKYWAVNGFDYDKINFDLENDSYAMYFQYDVQKQGEVTRTLKTAKRINLGD